MKSFLQTKEWLEFQESVGHKVHRFEGKKILANIIKYNLPLGKSYLYIPHGPEVDLVNDDGGLKNDLANFLKYLKDLAKEERAIFVKMEPLSDMVMELLYRRGFRRSDKQIQPYKTIVLDLNKSEEELLTGMHHKTRYNINLSEKKGLVLEESDSVESFWELLKQTAKKDQFSTHPKEYYEKMFQFFMGGRGDLKLKLFLVKKDEKYVAGELVMLFGDQAYYLHGASSYDDRALMAPYFMHRGVIKKLKVEGCKSYDLWGIDSKKWPGVTRFKLGWGGEQKEYPGSFDFVISKTWYWSYLAARKVF